MYFRRAVFGTLIGLQVAVSCLMVSAADELRLMAGGRVHQLEAVYADGSALYRLSEIGSFLNLQTSARDGIVEVTGPRGVLTLEDGRPLARIRDQYVLFSAPVRRSLDQWYVPADFLTRGASLLLDRRIELASPGTYQVKSVDENRVGVEIVSYPDHVTVIFSPSRRTPIRVQESRRFVKVQFEEFPVSPVLSSDHPGSQIVAGVRFDRTDPFGSFEILKGPKYDSFRQYDLNSPNRKIVELYGPPVNVVSLAPADPGGRPLPKDIRGEESGTPSDAEDAPLFEPDEVTNVITIDPGHGGQDHGSSVSQEMLEKTLNAQLAQLVSARLGRTVFRTELTRQRDVNLTEDQRSSFANLNQSKAFVSIHAGTSSSQTVSGPVVYVHRYFDAGSGRRRMLRWQDGQRRHLVRSRRLAEMIQSELNAVFGVEQSVREAPLAVLAPVMGPAVLVEAGFISHPSDRNRLQDPEFQAQIADAIVRGLLRFLR